MCLFACNSESAHLDAKVLPCLYIFHINYYFSHYFGALVN